MTIEAILAFAAAFAVLAISPGPGLVAILSRTLGGGMAAGLAVTAGLVVGDAIFLAIAMIGMSAIASALGPMFQIIKYAGAAYLIWLGIDAIRNARSAIDISRQPSHGLVRDVGLGLVVTLGNPKPIVFYGALLPTFLDLTRTSVGDFAAMMTIVVVVSFAVYSVYMLVVDRARKALTTGRTTERLTQMTGVMLIGSGVAVATR